MEHDRTEANAASAKRTVARMVGPYEILEEIGRGGMGIVYKARQPKLDRQIAFKELHSVHASSPELVQRFARESRLAGSLSHPNIITVHDYVEDGPASGIAMEYMPRGSLRSWVGDLSLAQLTGVLEGLLAGLAEVEPAGIVHRDLKPENVMVTDDGRVKITDFGVAKTTQNAGVLSFMTSLGTTVGTPAYMAPEQAISLEVGPWTDLYSVGVMAYEQLVGHVPFHDSPTPTAILLRRAHDPIPPVIDIRPKIHRSLSEWVARLLVKEPSGRTPSAVQAWEELEEIVLELLGPRWRRGARLPERGTSTDSPKPLTPAPFDSRQIQTPSASLTPPPAASARPDAPAQPEAESGFISYGRAPTGAEQPPAPSSERPERPPISARRESSSHRPPATQRVPARTRMSSAWQPRGRRLAVVALLATLTGAAGFVLTPAGKGSPRTPARSGGVSANARSHGPSQAYAVALNGAMSTLNGVRASAGAQLERATSAHAQAEAIQRLAHAHEQAAAAVLKTATEPPERAANAAIVTALTDMGRGYSTMAGAARREDHPGFDNGRKAVTAATGALAAAFVQLHKLGYRLSD
jgi:serine/threonine protein kinase